MTHPDIVQSVLGDEGVAARVNLGDDALFVTPTRTILYRADKLLSDESVEEFPHGAERVGVSSGRRKATITLDYGLDGERSFSVPSKALDRALHPVLAGTLNAVGVTDPGETVKETFRFSELTLVITSDRLVKHVGSAVWDEEFEEFHYDDVTDLSFEEGSVATTLVLTLGTRQERFKAPNERARELRERLTEAVLAYHGVDDVATLRERFAVDEDEAPSPTMSFGEGPTPLSVNPGELTEQPKNATRTAEDDTEADETVDATPAVGADSSAEATAEAGDDVGSSESGETTSEPEPTSSAQNEQSPGFESIGSGDLLGPADDAVDETEHPAESESIATGESEADELAALAAEVGALRESVEAQNERIARQEELIERLIVELRSRL